MTFRVGQKVVCIDDSQDPLRPAADWMDGDKPTVGWIYTVIGHDRPDLGRACIFINGFSHWGFLASRFRPLVENKKSAEVFTRMLTPSKVQA